MWRTLLRLSGLWIAAVLLAAPAAGQPAADELFTALGAKAGATLCEIGAGSGSLTLDAARIAGPGGRVYTSELGETRLERLRAAVAGSGLSQITVVAGSSTATNFPDGACDAVFMRDVYHHFTDPPAMNAAVARSLKPGGRVAVIDFMPRSGSRAATPPDRGSGGTHGVHPDQLSAEMQDAGFQVASSEIGTRWFMLVFERR